jgi:predicted permease
MAITSTVLPIFLLIGGGFLLRKYDVVKEEWVHTLNSFVYYVALPALIVVSFWNISWSTPGLLRLIGNNVLFLVGFALVLGIFLTLLPMNRRLKASIFLVALVSNSIYMGFPIGEQAFGTEGTASVVGLGTLFLVLGILLSIVGIELFWQPKQLAAYVVGLLRNPLALGVAAGVIVSFIGAGDGVLSIVRSTVGMVGAIASPAALITLGSFLYGRFVKDVVWFSILGSALKLFAFPILIFFVDILLGGTVREVSVSMLLAAMPTAVTTFVIAEQFDLDQSLVASTIVLSTVASVVTIPLVLLLWS